MFVVLILSITNIHPIKTYVLGNSSVWRSASLRERYPALQTTYPDYTDFYFPAGPCCPCKGIPNCQGYGDLRHIRTVSVILTAMKDSLNHPEGLFLAFEDDAILTSTCPEYTLPEPIPNVCEYISIYTPGTIHNRHKRSGKYKISLTGDGYGTVGFWFHTRFARWMLTQKRIHDPIDIIIYQSSKTYRRGICFISTGCVVRHNNNPTLRIKSM